MIYYTYLYLRCDGTPYYVGKGCGRRAYRTARRVRPPRDKERVLIQEFNSESDALAAEVFLISYYGRKDLGTGRLLNLTEGGDKAHRKDYIVTAIQRERIRETLRSRNISPTILARQLGGSIAGAMSKGKPWSKARREAQKLVKSYSTSRKGKPWSEARRNAYAAKAGS